MNPNETPLTVMLLTYGEQPERAEYAYRTLHAVLDRMWYPGPLFVHIADDGSPEQHRSVLAEIAGGYTHLAGITVSNSARGGYGASYNAATQAIHSRGGAVLPLEDDWELTVPLDAGRMVGCLGDEIQCIRLGYLGWTQPLRAQLLGVDGVTFWLLDPESAEPHVFAGHPRIETVEFERRVGEWPLGLNAGATEFAVAHRPASRIGVAWPNGWPGFGHIGTVQARTDQLEAVT
jgi:hypothetical protein